MKESDPSHEAIRVQESFLAPMEKTCLVWLANHTPKAIGPDHLTALGLTAMFMAGVCYALASQWPPALLLVCICLAVNWFGDSLDGTLARVRNQQRPRYGFYVDHMVDAVGALFLLGGLAASGYMSERVAMAMLIGFLLLSIDAYLATYSLGVFHISFWKFSPTEMRILLAIGNVYAFAKPEVKIFGERFLFFDVAGFISVLSMSVVLLVSVGRNTMALYRAERVG